jgi:hypothetical protein
MPGEELLIFDWWGTALFTVTAVLGVVAPSVFRWPAVVVALVLFAIGFVGFVPAFLMAAYRSRYEQVSTAGVYFLAGGAVDRAVQGRFWLLVGAQTVVAVVTASVRPFTTVAFGILVPTFGLGLMALWGANHARFPERPEGTRHLPD